MHNFRSMPPSPLPPSRIVYQCRLSILPSPPLPSPPLPSPIYKNYLIKLEASISDLCLNGSRISRLACPFLLLLLTSSHIALYLLLANYFTAIASTSVSSSGRYSSNSSTPASRLAKMIMSPTQCVRPTRNNERGHFLVTLL